MLHELIPADMIKLQTATDWKKVRVLSAITVASSSVDRNHDDEV